MVLQSSIPFIPYYETTNDINAALLREKQMKKWKRGWKTNLIEEKNPQWKDLASEYYG